MATSSSARPRSKSATQAARRLAHATACLALLALLGCERKAEPKGSLVFKRHGDTVETLPIATLVDALGERTVQTADPYYGEVKHFRALPLPALLALAFGEPVARLRERAFMLYASDGYAVPIEGSRLIDDRAFLAFDDVDVPGFAPIGPRKVSPAPAYLVWEGSALANLETHPRPWQLASVEIVDPEALYPHTLPPGAPKESAAMRGYHIFRERCIRCHAVNREGGNVGPELNVPQSIVDYRPEEQIRAYIKDPLTFRYGAMPPNPDLTESDLDALLAYFRAMSAHPHDPGAEETP